MKNLLRGLKNQTFDPIEVKVRDATSSDPWGAPSTLMAEIAEATQDYAQYPKLFLMLWKRLKDYQIHMHVQKALLLVEYLLRNGSDRFVRDAQFRADDVAKLKRYKYYNKNNEDIAGDIRKKAKVVHDLLTNADQLAEEREKAMQLRGVRSSHAAPAADAAPKRAARPAAAGAGDAYDNYSDVSKQEAFEQAVREEVERRQKAEAAARRKAQAQAQPTEEYEEQYEEQPAPAARPKPKAAARASGSSSAAPGGKPRPKPAAQPVQQQYEEEEDAQQAPPRLQQPAKPKNSKARAPSQQMQPQPQDDPFGSSFDNAFAQPQDPFNPNAHQQPRPKKNVDMFLADALGNNPAPQQQTRQQPAASPNIDLLTGAFENQQISMDDYDQYDDGQHPGDGGQVMWEPENEDEEEQPQPPQQQQHRGGGGDWGDLINLDNVTAEKKQAAPKKQGKPMSEMAAKRGSVIMGSAIDGFEAPAASSAPAPAPYYGGAANSPPAYGANYPPNNNYYGGPMMGGAPMAAGPMGGAAPMGGYPPMTGYPATGPSPPQAAARRPAPAQPAANPFNW